MRIVKFIAKAIFFLLALFFALAYWNEASALSRLGIGLFLGLGYVVYLIEDIAKKERALLEDRFERLHQRLAGIETALPGIYLMEEAENWASERRAARRHMGD